MNLVYISITVIFLTASCFAEWGTYHGGSDLAGYANIDFPEKPEQIWRFKADSEVILPPVTGDGMIFFISGKGTLYALNSSGNQKWSRPAVKGEDFSSPPVYVNGMIAMVSYDGSVYVLDAETGTQKWKHILKDTCLQSSPNWFKAGNSYQLAVMANQAGQVHCFDLANGTLLKKFEETARTDGSAVVNEKQVMFGNCEAALHVFSTETGKKKGSVELGESGQVAVGPALSGDLVFTGTHGGKLFCVDVKNLKVKWENEDSDGALLTTPAVDAKNVVFASDDGTVYCADRKDGRGRWSFDTKGTPTGVVILKDKVMAVSDGKIFLLKLNDGSLLWSKEVGDEASSPALIGNLLIVGSDDDYVTAFGKGDKKP
jgi:outer membrane protein assembly factor BamB